MEKKWITRIRMLIIAVAILVTFVSIIIFTRAIGREVNNQTKQTLRDVGNQNALTVEREITERQNFLQGMAKELQEHAGVSVEEMLNIFEPYVEKYHFKRMGYIHKDGIAYTTDGYCRDLSYRDFYIRGMKGESVITDVMQDALGEPENINVLSVPVYRKSTQKIAGVLFATYRTSSFEELLNVECFEGDGYSMIIKQNGSIVADSSKSIFYGKDNYFNALIARNGSKNNKNEIKAMKAAMKKDKSGTADFSYKSEQYLYYTPIDNKMEEQWYMITIVPAKTFQSRVSPLLHNIWVLLAIIIVVLLLVTIIFSYSYGKDKKTLIRLAYMDPLTEGDNYAYFIEKMYARNETGKLEFIVALDFNEFKVINSTCGIAKGDETLQAIWRVIDNSLNRYELAAHINADHYILYLLAGSKKEVTYRIEKLTRDFMSLPESLQIPDLLPYYGIYQIEENDGVEKGYNKANQAKHFVKGSRTDNFAFFEDVDYAQEVENKRLADGFEEAIANHRFEVWYQPKYSTDGTKAVGAEALVRWREKDGSLIPPFKFIPLFEKNGMIARLDEYVFEEVCRQQKEWLDTNRTVLPVSINISRASLYYSSIVEKYVKIVKEHGVPIEYIQLEITESAMIENSEVKELLDRFHAAGFQLLLDDFGNGYSSLATLNTLHFDVLKVDKSLIDYIGNEDGEKLLKCIVELAKSLGLRTTAEGVESIEQVRFLQNLQCNDIQGYYFSKPLPLADYEELISK